MLNLNDLHKKLELNLPSPVNKLRFAHFNHPLIGNAQKNDSLKACEKLQVYVKRDDLIHEVISGNKWRKLAAIAEHVVQKQHSPSPIKHIMSFGGAYSNHLHALAYLCTTMGIKFSPIIRGDYSANLTPMLQDIITWGATPLYISKIEYKHRHQSKYYQSLAAKIGADMVIPEGGSSIDAFKGLAEMASEISTSCPDLTHIVLPVASGGSLAGLAHYCANNKKMRNIQIIGVGVLKGENYLENLVNNLLNDAVNISEKHRQDQNKPPQNWQILHDYHHGGYAKTSPQLVQFINHFNKLANVTGLNANEHCPSINIEPTYSGKCFFALQKLIEKQFFPLNSKIMVIHTGGLQAIRNKT